MTESAPPPIDLAMLRRAYARQMLAIGEASGDTALEDAFAAVPREAFLGPPPWRLLRPGTARPLEVSDPVLLYQDVLVPLQAERGVNNGSPSLHARLIHRLAPRPGDRVAHLGAGAGYYSAILARLVGPGGRLAAVEYDADLAAAARRNLAGLPQAEVIQGDAAAHPGAECDGIYVSFSTGRPAAPWLDRLAPGGGRLVFPLGAAGPAPHPGAPRHARHGAALLVTRLGTESFAAESLGPAWYVHAEGALAADGPEAEALEEAFLRGGIEHVRSLRRGAQCRATPRDRAWVWSPDWCLGYDPPP